MSKTTKNKKPRWFGCRDLFADQIGVSRPIVFYKHASPAIQKRVFAFIERAQDILKLPQKDRARPCVTNNDKVIAFRMSHWWRKKIRMSLFTILLRAGRNYRGRNTSKTLDTFWKTAERSKYLKSKGTSTAFRRFMDGNTSFRMTRWGSGWVNTFRRRTPSEIEQLLVKEKRGKIDKH